jgi:hypothetical protein
MVSGPNAEPPHLLFNPKVMGIDVVVFVTGDKYKQKKLVVHSAMVDGQPRILHRSRGTNTGLDPKWVSLAEVNIMRYEGLLVVIKGEHLGKFGRRIHHGQLGEEKTALIAFVNRVNGGQDTLTGEEQHLPAACLAMVHEEKAEKDKNDLIVESRRKAARARY